MDELYYDKKINSIVFWSTMALGAMALYTVTVNQFFLTQDYIESFDDSAKSSMVYIRSIYHIIGMHSLFILSFISGYMINRLIGRNRPNTTDINHIINDPTHTSEKY